MKSYLIIFAKEPKRDKIKTRLSNYLSSSQCVKLYRAFLKDTMGMIKDVKCSRKIIAFDSDTKNPKYLKSIAPHFIFYRQKGKNLGQRMHNVFKFAARNPSKIVIIGSDSPTLPSGYIEEAFRKLDRNDIVIGPSRDGGYYLIGLKKACGGLFKGIKWSSDRVLEKTVMNAAALKKKIFLLEKWYDVDKLEDLDYLKKDLRRKSKDIAIWTRRYLQI
jgi:rSAM/selenodomain-associated transferase 1